MMLVQILPDGTITVEFENCNSGTVAFSIPSISQQGAVPRGGIEQPTRGFSIREMRL
jgi:hypothetical protein